MMISLIANVIELNTIVWLQYLLLTLFDRHMTGHIEHPRVQQQQRQPQKSHRTLSGSAFLTVWLMRLMVALYSSGATRACRVGGNSVSKRLDRPNLEEQRNMRTKNRGDSTKAN